MHRKLYPLFLPAGDIDRIGQLNLSQAVVAVRKEGHYMQQMLTETAANLYIQDLCDLVVMRHDMTGLQFSPTFVMDLSTVQWVTE